MHICHAWQGPGGGISCREGLTAWRNTCRATPCLDRKPDDVSIQELGCMLSSWAESNGCAQGGATKLKEYMCSLSIPKSHIQGYTKTRSCSACVSTVEDLGCAQGGATKLKEYMRSLNILPQKRKRKPSDGIPRSPRSPRSPDGLLPGATVSDL